MNRALFITLAVLAGAGCNAPTHIEIDPKQPVLKSKVDTLQLVGHVMSKSLEDAEKRVTWSSKDDSIATADEAGHLFCHKGGRTWIVATYGKVSATVPVECLFVEKLRSSLESVELSFEKGDPVKPVIEAIGYDGRPIKDRRPFYKPQDEKVCRVDQSGQFWPVNKGSTVVVVELDQVTTNVACTVGK
jgi:hypothetical protein